MNYEMNRNMTDLQVVGEDFEQEPLFPGWKIVGRRFALRSANNLPTEKILTENEHVSGTFRGRVKGYRSNEEPDGSKTHTWIIEVLDADLE